MFTPWGGKGSNRPKGTRKRKVHWDALGLRDPTVTSSTPSIEDLRRQIISASNHGLSRETLARAQTKGASRQSGSQAAVTAPKQKVRS